MIGRGHKLTTEEFILRAKLKHGDKYDYSKTDYTGLYNKLIITCSKHGDVFQVAKDHLKGSNCRYCKCSKGEEILVSFFKEQKIAFTKPVLSRNKRKYYPDFYLPKFNLFIEYNGSQHYTPVVFAGMDKNKSEIRFEQQKIRDAELKEICIKEKIELIEIDGREFKDVKLIDLIRSIIKQKEKETQSIKLKPWGQEEWCGVTSRVVMKKLTMKAGHQCSLQYHEQKEEMFYLLSGQAEFTVGPDMDNLKTSVIEPGFYFTLPKFMIHQMKAITDIVYLEASTPELFDVQRLTDLYGRADK
jgi:mannose-6-phosphate isomerase-like protein (cupin superfamily)/very-short-patch-repair endonuclease